MRRRIHVVFLNKKAAKSKAMKSLEERKKIITCILGPLLEVFVTSLVQSEEVEQQSCWKRVLLEKRSSRKRIKLK